jgi:hypothetical protein
VAAAISTTNIIVFGGNFMKKLAVKKEPNG